MEYNEKIKIIKNLKTAERLTKQVKTMVSQAADKINSDGSCKSTEILKDIALNLNSSCELFKDNADSFKKDLQLGGYQLTLFEVD